MRAYYSKFLRTFAKNISIMSAFKKRPRARWHDYNDGIYFVTIATFNRRHYFGEVIEGAMLLNNCGKIALQQIEMLEQRLDYVEVHNAVVMPNHIHLMVQIISTRYGVTVRHNTENIGALHAPEHPDDGEVPFEERTHYASLLSTSRTNTLTITSMTTPHAGTPTSTTIRRSKRRGGWRGLRVALLMAIRVYVSGGW